MREDGILNVAKPSRERMHKMISPLRRYFSPTFFGLDNIDTRQPYLFIGNHPTLGFFDTILMFDELLWSKDIFLRGMADHSHFPVPYWRDFISKSGGGIGECVFNRAGR
jgi:1-acyl-sn-glycerol-3-phosphate acyltransferase